jgi:dienelactone hydrolase
MPEEEEVRRGYEQFAPPQPPQPPPGMYFDPASELVLPQGVRLASRGQVAGAWFLGFLRVPHLAGQQESAVSRRLLRRHRDRLRPGRSSAVTLSHRAPSEGKAKERGASMTSTGPAHNTKVKKLAFTVARDGEDVPAVLWLPERPAERRALVLLGHGGGGHKEAPFVTWIGRWLASGPNYAALAIDLPYHGDRTPADEIGMSVVERRSRMGLQAWRARNSEATSQAVADWQAAITAVQDLDQAVHASVGYVGLSMGTRFGVPLAAAEPRITAAVFGLFGHPAKDTESAFARAARQVTIPVLYLQQWDDEFFPRNDGLALFDMFATRDKTMHVNPGGHLGIPRAEMDSVKQFLLRRLRGSDEAGPWPD